MIHVLYAVQAGPKTIRRYCLALAGAGHSCWDHQSQLYPQRAGSGGVHTVCESCGNCQTGGVSLSGCGHSSALRLHSGMPLFLVRNHAQRVQHCTSAYALLTNLSDQMIPVWNLLGNNCGTFAHSSLELELIVHKGVRPWPGRLLNHACLVTNASQGWLGLDLRSRPTGLLSMHSRPSAGKISICLPRPWPDP